MILNVGLQYSKLENGKMISVKKIAEQKINQIWEKYSEFTFAIPPITIENIPDAKIIFIGINPSLSHKDKTELLKGPDKSLKLKFYNIGNDLDNTHKYFKKFYEIGNKTDLCWSHYDLLFIQETKQEKVKELLKTKEGTAFIYDQLMVSKLVLNELIDKDRPRIFVINNTLAREFLGKDRPVKYKERDEHWLDFRFVWNEILGTYTYKNNIFFFSSMLTGQRALDKGSYERLIWHINYVKSIYLNDKNFRSFL